MRIKAENAFMVLITSMLDIKVVGKKERPLSHMHVPFNLCYWYIVEASKTTDKIVVAYEIPINPINTIYPDFLLMKNGKGLRVEIKDCETERSIANKIANLPKFLEDEFWYVVEDHININKIISNINNKPNPKIKVMYKHDLVDKINNFFE